MPDEEKKPTLEELMQRMWNILPSMDYTELRGAITDRLDAVERDTLDHAATLCREVAARYRPNQTGYSQTIAGECEREILAAIEGE